MNDDPLHNAFHALRTDDARHAPSFNALAAPVSDSPRRSLWPWQLTLGGPVAAAILLAFHLAANSSPTPLPGLPSSTDLAAVSDQLAPVWSAPSDTLLADATPSAAETSPESTADLIRDIDRLLQTPSPL